MTSGDGPARIKVQYPASYDSTNECTGEHALGLSLTVLFTTAAGTLNALRKARQLGDQLRARIRILFAYVVPYPIPIDKPPVNPELRLRQIRSYCERESIDARLDILLCRDARECIHDVLLPHSLVVIGGRPSWWPLMYEKRLAIDLKSAGHHVILVEDRGRSKSFTQFWPIRRKRLRR
jgi:hypothetical protein